MTHSKVCRVLDELGRDENYRKLKLDFLSESTSTSQGNTDEAYKRVLRGVLDVLAECEDPETDVKLNSECLLLIEDIATNGKCRFPWKVVKMLILLVYTRLFDELYQDSRTDEVVSSSEPGTPEPTRPGSPETERSSEAPESLREKKATESEEEFKRLKHESAVYILGFDLPPFTLQRLCEIPLRQPYMVCRKLFNAYRKLFSVRNIEYEPVLLPPSVDLTEFAQLERVYLNLEAWERTYRAGLHPEWNEDLLSENSDEPDSSDGRPFKRALE